jgi:hypothetical protein
MPTFPGYAAPTQFGVDTAIFQVGGVTKLVTNGGLSFDPGREIMDIDFDGKSTRIAGHQRVAAWNPVISGNAKNASADAIMMYEPGSTSDGSSPESKITPLPAREFFQSGTYLQDCDYIINRQGNLPLRYHFDWMYVETYSFTTPDKQANDIAVRIVGCLEPGAVDLEKCPYDIYDAITTG